MVWGGVVVMGWGSGGVRAAWCHVAWRIVAWRGGMWRGVLWRIVVWRGGASIHSFRLHAVTMSALFIPWNVRNAVGDRPKPSHPELLVLMVTLMAPPSICHVSRYSGRSWTENGPADSGTSVRADSTKPASRTPFFWALGPSSLGITNGAVTGVALGVARRGATKCAVGAGAENCENCGAPAAAAGTGTAPEDVKCMHVGSANTPQVGE